MRKLIVFLVALGLAGAAHAGIINPKYATGFSPNIPVDTDGDGLTDTVYVSDYDHDGTLEMQDIQDAYDALTSTTGKNVYVMPGSYTASFSTANTHGFFEITSSKSRITCAEGAVLNGLGIQADSSHRGLANIYIADADDVDIGGCELNGGLSSTGTYDSDIGTIDKTPGSNDPFRFGIYGHDGQRVVIHDNYIHDVMQSGIYVNGTDDLTVRNNHLVRIGGYADIANSASVNGAIYLYTDNDDTNSKTVLRPVVEGNRIEYAGSSGIVFRVGGTAATGERITDGVIQGNSIYRASVGIQPGGGTQNTKVIGNVINQCGQGITTHSGATDYFPIDTEGTAGTTIESNVIEGSYNTSAYAIQVNAYNAGWTMRNNTLSGNAGYGLQWTNPQRGFVVDGMRIRNTWASALLENTGASGAVPDEFLTFRNVLIDGVDAADSTDTPLYLGTFSKSQANTSIGACTQDRQGQWLTLSNAHDASDPYFNNATDIANVTANFPNRAICTATTYTQNTMAADNTAGVYKFTDSGAGFSTSIRQGDIIYVNGFTTAANNGTFTVSTGSDASNIYVTEAVTTEAANNNVRIQWYGWADKAIGSYTGTNFTAIDMQGGPGLIMDGITVSGYSNYGAIFRTANFTGAKLTNWKIDGKPWGYLGAMAEATLAGNAKMECGTTDEVTGKWAITTNTSSSSDVTLSGGTGTNINAIYCNPGGTADVGWTDASGGEASTRHGIGFNLALTGDGPFIDNIRCQDVMANSASNCVDIKTASTAANGTVNATSSYNLPLNSVCTAASTPWVCCTGAGAGNCDTPPYATDYVVEENEPTTGWAGWTIKARGTNLSAAQTVDNGASASAKLGSIVDITSSGAATAELCDDATEKGSVWKRTDGAAGSTLYVCEDGAAWTAK